MQQRTWFYTLTEKLSDDRAHELMAAVDNFLGQWKSHGTPVAGTAALHYGQFLVLQAAPDGEMPSGCSRDSLNRGVSAVLQQHGLSYFDAGVIGWKQADGNLALMDFRSIKSLITSGQLTDNTIVLDNTLSNTDDLTKWEVLLKDTWMKKYL